MLDRMLARARYQDVPPLDQLEEPQIQGLMSGVRKRFAGEAIGSLMIFAYGYAATVQELANTQGSDNTAAAYLGLAMIGGAIGTTSIEVTWGMYIDCRNQLRTIQQPQELSVPE